MNNSVGSALSPAQKKKAASNSATVKRARITKASWVKFGLRLGIILLLLGIWYLITAEHIVSALVLPSPSSTWDSTFGLLRSGSLVSNSGITLEAAGIGFGIGMAAGTLVGFLIGLSPFWTSVLEPFVTAFNALPRIALAPLFVLWFGIGTESGAVLVISLVLFIALTNTITGTRSIDRNYLTIVRLYGGKRSDVILKVVLPSTIPWIVAAGRLSLAYALSGAIVSEMFLGQNGLGYLIVSGSGVFNTGEVFAAVIASLIIAAVLDRVGTVAEAHLLRWRPPTM